MQQKFVAQKNEIEELRTIDGELVGWKKSDDRHGLFISAEPYYSVSSRASGESDLFTISVTDQNPENKLLSWLYVHDLYTWISLFEDDKVLKQSFSNGHFKVYQAKPLDLSWLHASQFSYYACCPAHVLSIMERQSAEALLKSQTFTFPAAKHFARAVALLQIYFPPDFYMDSYLKIRAKYPEKNIDLRIVTNEGIMTFKFNDLPDWFMDGYSVFRDRKSGPEFDCEDTYSAEK